MVKKRIPSNSLQPGQSHITFPSFQKTEDQKFEISQLEADLQRLNTEKQMLEGHLARAGSRTRAGRQQRLDMERELENVTRQISETKHHLRQLDAFK